MEPFDAVSACLVSSDAETELYNDWRDWSYLRIVFTWNASVLPAVWPKLVVSVLWSVLVTDTKFYDRLSFSQNV